MIQHASEVQLRSQTIAYSDITESRKMHIEESPDSTSKVPN